MTRRLSLLVALGVVGFLLGVPTAAAGGGCLPPNSLEPSAGDDPVALIAECAFRPTVTYIEPGDSITWTSKDVYPHTVTGALGSWGNESMLGRGDSVTYRFEEEGVFPYFCAFHPSMVGTVVVGDADASLTSAAGMVDPADPADPASSAPGPRETDAVGTSSRAPIALGLGAAAAALLGAVGLRLALKKRSATAIPAP